MIDSPNGLRAHIHSFYLTCAGGMTAVPGPTWTSPQPCNPDPFTGLCRNGGDPNNPIVQDEWQPTLAITTDWWNNFVVGAYWYGTRDDVNNRLINTYFTQSFNFGSFTNPVALASCHAPAP